MMPAVSRAPCPAPRRRSGCPISIALEVLGDAWSLLIVRDLMFKNKTRFNDFLEAGEGIATNILSDRLQRLETVGIIQKGRDPSDGRRFAYRLTPKGMELAPVIVELVIWSASHHDTDAPPQVVKAMKSDRPAFIDQLRRQWKAKKSPPFGRAFKRTA